MYCRPKNQTSLRPTVFTTWNYTHYCFYQFTAGTRRCFWLVKNIWRKPLRITDPVERDNHWKSGEGNHSCNAQYLRHAAHLLTVIIPWLCSWFRCGILMLTFCNFRDKLAWRRLSITPSTKRRTSSKLTKRMWKPERTIKTSKHYTHMWYLNTSFQKHGHYSAALTAPDLLGRLSTRFPNLAAGICSHTHHL